MWNQVNCTQNYYVNIGTSAPYNQWLYPLVSCPHQDIRMGAHGLKGPLRPLSSTINSEPHLTCKHSLEEHTIQHQGKALAL
jgi:hypothetical protein